MSRYDDYRSSSERLERVRDRRYSRGAAVLDRPPRMEEDRFESRLHETDRYGPPARRSDRLYEDDHLIHTSGPLVAYDRPRGESPPPRPRLLRRQSSLDTFDRIPSRKLDEFYYHGHLPPRDAPAPSIPRRRPSRRHKETDYYEDIRIAEPDYYGDEEFRGFRERDRYAGHPRRSSGRVREELVEEIAYEKPYPRKGKTRMPRRLVHTHAIRKLGYPYQEEDDLITIQLALSKEQIDEVISLSREVKRHAETRVVHARRSPSPIRARRKERTVEKLTMETYSPRASHNTLIIEASPSRHRSTSRYQSPSRYRSPSRHYELSEKRVTRAVSRTRSISVHGRHRRLSSPVRMMERFEPDKTGTSPLAVVIRPRDSDEDLHELRRLELADREEVIRDTERLLPNGDVEEITEVKRDRRGPNPRILRAMMATLT
ncbi:uncharacterized protein ACLA_070420 [Aspergillus clavatus NRRL 1]|uniref:DUF8035 domain-containing protein n=1 Tax=Aspergillus clavatus (strain ATCC 1007 / CBS 513.65 / DSM 816 / NCTC 3887 / NRRL 1 / QM 1276 / 107) TaxID=344612 RepID=A1C6I9_ASPCL|nr:uncharacterized protein ACLA_070420 [Aspergillus clavatus NRRL 1]EAW14010.1 conserved hypothetical protein [Aspergillus clavatus NRRL 1]